MKICFHTNFQIFIFFFLRGKSSKGKGTKFMRETACEGEERRGTRSPSSRSFRAFHAPKISFSFPLERQKRVGKKEKVPKSGIKKNVFTRNFEILVKRSHYFNSIFVLFLACQCSCFKKRLE